MAVNELDSAASSSTTLGISSPRLDSEDKVRGRTRYVADLFIPGLLHARPVLGIYAHARITGIVTSSARNVPGVVAVLTADDIPIAGDGNSRSFEPLARTEVVFAGQPVAFVVAETEEAAADAVELVEVSYERLPAAIDLEDVLKPGAPIARPRAQTASPSGASVHAAAGGTGTEVTEGFEPVSANVVNKKRYRRGNVAEALAQCAAVVEGRFTTSWTYQAYLEPQSAIAVVDPDGTLTVTTSSQGIFYVRAQLAQIYGLPPDRVRVIGAPLGGAFGGKIMFIEPLVAGIALAVGRPVRLVLTRREDFAMSNPAQATVLEVRIGGGPAGLAALEARAVLDTGAYAEWSVEGLMPVLLGGPYRWSSWDVQALAVQTNRVGTGSYRAPGAPQATFALESLVDELAARLDMDPIDLRIQSAAQEGDEMIDGKSWPALGIVACLEEARRHPMWTGRSGIPSEEGVGLAAGYWPGQTQAAAALCRLDPDGVISVLTAAVDVSGATSGFAVIAAEVIGVPLDHIRVRTGDTSSAPLAPLSAGSVITYAVGRAVQHAAELVRDQLLDIASMRLEIDREDLEIEGDSIQPKGSPGLGIRISQLAREMHGFGFGHPPVEGHGRSYPSGIAPSSAVNLAHVRVDPETGRTCVLGFAIIQDVGRALNPALVEGQMRGGVTQAIGWGLMEGLQYDEHGNLVTGSFLDYAIPGAPDVPFIDTTIVEVPSAEGPFGAKGMGETPVVCGAGALANAIAAAIDVRPRHLPITAPQIWRMLHGRDTAA